MDELITKLQEKAKACGDKTKEDRARKGAYIDCIIELKAFKISSKPVLDDVLLEQSNWLMVNSSLEVEKIVDLKMHLQKHFI